MSAEEKSHKPTAHKLQQARDRGNVPRTTELGPALAFLAMASATAIAGSRIWTAPFQSFARAIQTAGTTDLALGESLQLYTSLILPWFPALVILLGSACAGGVAALVLQGGPAPTAEPFKLDPEKMNPFSKLQSLFTLKHLWGSSRAFIAGGITLWIVVDQIREVIPLLPGLSLVSSAAIGARIGEILVGVAWRAGLAMVFLGILDLFINYLLYMQEMKMSRDELKQESKDQEGRPEIKAQRRRRAAELARGRGSIHEVARADVVVTNPTHYAVALVYRRSLMQSPKVVAKGRDRMAQRIRLEAIKHDIPIVENPPLARELYRKVGIDQEVPPEMFLAVAEVIAFIMRLNASINLGDAGAGKPVGAGRPGRPRPPVKPAGSARAEVR